MSQVIPKPTKQKTDLVSLVADFLIKHGKGLYVESERSYIEEYIATHIGYGTLMLLWKEKELVAAVRWNWVSNEIAKILDLVIHPDYRDKALLRDMLIELEKEDMQNKKAPEKKPVE